MLVTRQFGGLHHVSACSALSVLDLVTLEADTRLQLADREAIGKLTKLTCLALNTQDGQAAPAACYTALQQLTRLQALGLSGLTQGLWIACSAGVDMRYKAVG